MSFLLYLYWIADIKGTIPLQTISAYGLELVAAILSLVSQCSKRQQQSTARVIHKRLQHEYRHVKSSQRWTWGGSIYAQTCTSTADMTQDIDQHWNSCIKRGTQFSPGFYAVILSYLLKSDALRYSSNKDLCVVSKATCWPSAVNVHNGIRDNAQWTKWRKRKKEGNCEEINNSCIFLYG